MASNGLIKYSVGGNSKALNAESTQKRKDVNIGEGRGEGQQRRKKKVVLREFGAFSAGPSLGSNCPQGPTGRSNEVGQGSKMSEVQNQAHFDTMGGRA